MIKDKAVQVSFENYMDDIPQNDRPRSISPKVKEYLYACSNDITCDNLKCEKDIECICLYKASIKNSNTMNLEKLY